jgi:oligopeptide transport system ATP-binding protein
MSEVILKVDNLKQYFKTGVGKNKFVNRAVDGISFEVKRGEVFSLVGESGCGKTTTGRTIIRLYKPTDGEVFLLGKRVCAGLEGYQKRIVELRKSINKDKKLEQNEEITNRIQFSLSEIERLKKEIIQAKKDQKDLYKPEKKDYIDLKYKNTLLIQEINALIDEENKKFLDFKAHVFDEVDSLPSDTAPSVREQLHKSVLKTYIARRTEKNNIIAKYKDEIDILSNEIYFFNRPLTNKMQMIFQDPIDSLDPRMTVKDIIAEGLYINGITNKKIVLERVYNVLKLVGLLPEHADHYPHEFSGGQRQRVGIARAIINDPELIIADEPISALDVSIQAQVINLLNELRQKLGLTVLFIAHDLSVVKFLSDKIAVMYYGHIVEMGSKDKIFNHPLHPYTLSLISAIPMPDPEYEKYRGDPIRYNPQMHDYSINKPSLREIEEGHFIYANDEEFANYQKLIK